MTNDTLQKEIRVYVVNADDGFDFHKATDEEIITHCEETGLIYSLPFFEEQINNEELDLSNSFIRVL